MFRLLAFLVVLLPTPVFSAVCLSGDGWEPFTFEDIQPNQFEIAETGEIAVSGNSSASFVIHPLMVDLSKTPVISWRWRVDSTAPPSSLDRKGGDDRPIAVYVAFPYDSESASLGERMRRSFVEASQGSDAPGRIIAYIWGGKKPAGSRYQNPYTGSESQFVIVEQGDTPKGEWRQVKINVADDYQSLFGAAMNKIQYVAVFSDSDDSKSQVEARIADICFSEPAD